MILWLARAALFRFLPRRLLPILTAVEVLLIVRALMGRKQPSTEPTESRTSPEPTESRTLPDRPDQA